MTNARTARAWLLDGARRRARGREALRRRVDQRRGGAEVRDRHREHVRVLGLGRRTLFDGIGDRPVDDDRDRSRAFPRDARRLRTRWTSTSARRRSSRTCRRCWGCSALWYADFFDAQTIARPALRASISKRFPAYLQQLDDGEQRQARDARRRARRLRDRADLLGRAGHERPALVLPADSPGHEAHPVRLHRLLRSRSTRSAITTIC